MSNEEVKEEVEKVPEEVEEVSKKVAEDVQEEVQTASKEVNLKEEKEEKFVNITKLKCNYTTYKNERTKLKMLVITKCQKCCKSFKDGDELYFAYKRNDKTGKKYLICKNCTKK